MKKLSLAILLFAGMFIGEIQAQNKNDILVTIGSEKITAGEFLETYGKNNNLKTATTDDIRDYLELFINFKMKVMEGMELKYDTARQFQMELQSYKRQSTQQYLVDKEEMTTEFYSPGTHFSD